MGNPKSLKFFENIAIQYLGKVKKFQNNIINGLGEPKERKKAWALSAPPPLRIGFRMFIGFINKFTLIISFKDNRFIH